jgi:hypothetical protein
MIDFPQNPTVGQEFTDLGIIWYWDGVKWTFSPGSSSGYLPLVGGVLTGPVGTTSTIAIPAPSDFLLGGGVNGNALVTNGANVLSWENILSGASISDTPPVSPTVGQLWWDSVGGQLYVWFNDGTSTQWVIANNSVAALADFLPLIGGTLTGPLNGTEINAATLAAPGGVLAPVAVASPPIADNSLSLATTAWANANVKWGDNRLINGDMRINQYNAGAAGVNSFICDRWYCWGSTTGKFSQISQQGNGPPGIASGLGYSILASSAGAYVIPATEAYGFGQALEADMMQDFAFGTPDAQPITLSFWVFCTLAGTYGGMFQNYAATRTYPFTFTAPANVWTKIVVTIPGDTGGTWVLQGNGGGAWLGFDFGSGATMRGPAGVWSNTPYNGANGTVALISNNNAQINFTNIKLEIGTVATPFNHKSLAECMTDCQRYFQRIGNSFGSIIIQGYVASAGMTLATSIGFSAMRSIPTALAVGTWTAPNVSTWSFYPGVDVIGFQINCAAAGQAGMYTADATTYLQLDAEL